MRIFTADIFRQEIASQFKKNNIAGFFMPDIKYSFLNDMSIV